MFFQNPPLGRPIIFALDVKDIVERAAEFECIPLESWTQTEHILLEFDVHHHLDIPSGVFTERYLISWLCTDTRVGLWLTYFRGELVCVNYQPYRKSDVEVYWVSSVARDMVRDYVYGILAEEAGGDCLFVDDCVISPIITLPDPEARPYYENSIGQVRLKVVTE